MEKNNKKNVLFWVGVKSTDSLLQEKHGGFKYLDISKKCWEWWCEKNDVIFFPYETATFNEDTGAHRPTWQRWFDVFKQLDAANINYNKIAVIDGSTLIRWDAPDFFKYAPNGKLSCFRSLENLRWISEGVEGYNKLFNGYEFKLNKYIDCGFQIFDKEYKKFLTKLEKYYVENYDEIIYLQTKTVKKGTDQPVYNYLLQIEKVDVVMNIPPPYMLTHLNRFDWFGYNWQLDEDKTPYFIKYGYIWKYSGFPQRGDRYNLMKQTWDMIKGNYE